MTDVVGKLIINPPASNTTEKYVADYSFGADGGAIGSYIMMECGADQVLVEDAYFVITENFASSESAAITLIANIPGMGSQNLNETMLASQHTTTEIRVFAQRYPDDTVTWATVNSFPVILRPGWQIGFKITTGAITAGAGKFVCKVARSFV